MGPALGDEGMASTCTGTPTETGKGDREAPAMRVTQHGCDARTSTGLPFGACCQLHFGGKIKNSDKKTKIICSAQ